MTAVVISMPGNKVLADQLAAARPLASVGSTGELHRWLMQNA